MSGLSPTENSLVLYKCHPARVLSLGDKLEIQLAGGETKRVRTKDIQLLHVGPLHDLASLTMCVGEVEEAQELLAGGVTDLAELAELVFGEFTPVSAWATWQLVAEGLYFHGTADEIIVRSIEEIRRLRSEKEVRLAAERQWSELIQRLKHGVYRPEDAKYLSGVEAVADGRSEKSRILQELGRRQTPEAAHALLLKIGKWDEGNNPYPHRLGVRINTPEYELPELAMEERLDLTHLQSYAIDDEGNPDPDDAISIDGNRLWVHVADVAALVPPDSEADLQARERGSSLYLPECTIPMLAEVATQRLGLGLNELSPALSFGLDLGDPSSLLEVKPSLIRATRLSYAQVEERLDEEPFARLHKITHGYFERRLNQGAILIDLPEVKVRVRQGEVIILPLPRLASRQMVMEAMLMIGEAAGRLAMACNIPFPFSSQAQPEVVEHSNGMAGMYNRRRGMRRSQIRCTVEPHAGLGLEVYSQVTSPLRRYFDLVAHQQLRAWSQGRTPLSYEQLRTRIGVREAAVGSIRRAERQSNRHWILVYLLRHPNWRGTAILVENRDRRGMVLIPELGLEVQVRLKENLPLNSQLNLALNGIDLPNGTANFQVLE
ncbi:MAG: RNB domain-containing ribonuclease [Gammaproteobacteria bacterium]|nr:RNB domain-containing ribonuclease [Gammaproteobacteria bacterium]